jgi:ribosome-binding protein aMBF1 (putative translation factor)
MGIFGGAPKTDVAAEQAKMKSAQDAAARLERDKMAASQAAQENQATAKMAQEQSARAAFTAGIVQDTDESRRKFLKKV